MGIKNKLSLYALSLLVCIGPGIQTATGQSATNKAADSQTYMIIRTDDAGMSHSANMGLQRLLETGYPVTVSVMFPCPWYQEAVSILKEYQGENLSVGIHLTLNSEWQHYRWGPVAGRSAVPSLVDENGYFFHYSADLYENNPPKEEVIRELRAQVERALDTGLPIDYMDYHMGTVSRDSMMMSVAEQLADEYDLALWGYFPSKEWYSHYRATPEDKIDSLTTNIHKMEPGYNHIVTHVGLDNDELGAMKDMNSDSPLARMSKHRQGELNALTSDGFAKAIKENGITVVTFRKLIDEVGLENMRVPGQAGY